MSETPEVWVGNCRKHEVRIVRGEQGLIGFLNEGWDLVKELTDDKFVLKRVLVQIPCHSDEKCVVGFAPRSQWRSLPQIPLFSF